MPKARNFLSDPLTGGHSVRIRVASPEWMR
jgi:hypothetical protein